MKYFLYRLSIKAFDKLVDDIICTEAAVRVVTENAVLLIFPSDLLPIRHQSELHLFQLFS